MTEWSLEAVDSLAGKNCIVTGASSGVGFATARILAEHGAKVRLACRSQARGDAARDRIVQATGNEATQVMALDLADLDSVRAFADAVANSVEALDLLVNNAGIMMPPLERTRQGFESQFGVNHLGHFALTGLLLPLLERGSAARIVTVASNAHRHGAMDFADLNYQRRRYNRVGAYGQSKLANLLFTLELSRRLGEAGSDVLALAAHPGWTSTNLMKYWRLARWLSPHFAMSPEQGAMPILRAATDRSARSGDYFGPDGPLGMWGRPGYAGRSRAAQDADAARRLWEHSERLTQVYGFAGPTDSKAQPAEDYSAPSVA